MGKKFLKLCQARLLLKKPRMIRTRTLKKSLRSCQAPAAVGDAVRPPLAAAVLRGGDAVMPLRVLMGRGAVVKSPRALMGGGAVMSLSPPRALKRGGDVMSLPLLLRVPKGGDAVRPPPQRVPLRGGDDVRPAVTLTVNICAKLGSQNVDG